MLTPIDDSENETNETVTAASANTLVTNFATTVLADDYVAPEDNNVYQPNGTVTISSSSTLELNTIDLMLENDDTAPTGIVLSAQPTSISEVAGPTPIHFTATVHGETTYASEQTIINIASSSGRIHGVDFDAVPDFVITIPPRSNSSSTIIELVHENDQEHERDETITFSGTNSPVTVESSITLLDDDQPPAGIAVSITRDVVAEYSGPTEVPATILVIGGTRYADEKALTLCGAGSGLPGAVGFVQISPITLSLPSGEALLSATFSLEPVDNLLDEDDEILTIAVAGNDIGVEAQHSLTKNDPKLARFSLAVIPDLVVEGDGPTKIRVTATVVGASRYSSLQTLDISVFDAIAGAVGYENVPDFTM